MSVVMAEFESPPMLDIKKGLSVRDWFAAVALEGMLSTFDCKSSYSEGGAKQVAESAYTLANAMLEAR